MLVYTTRMLVYTTRRVSCLWLYNKRTNRSIWDNNSLIPNLVVMNLFKFCFHFNRKFDNDRLFKWHTPRRQISFSLLLFFPTTDSSQFFHFPSLKCCGLISLNWVKYIITDTLTEYFARTF